MKTNDLKPMNGNVILCVSITKSLRERKSLYESTRKYWKHNLEYVQQATHVVGIANGEVKVVYDDMDWEHSENPEWADRVEFTSKHPEGIKSPYLGKYYKMYRATKMLK